MPNLSLNVELSKAQLIDALSQYSPNEVKSIMEELIKRNIFTPPKLEELTEEGDRVAEAHNLDISLVDEAVKWARSKK